MSLAVAAAAALALVAVALYLGFRWMTGRAMFQPGTVAQRVRDAGESLDPLPSASRDRWQVTGDVALVHDSFGAGTQHLLYVHGGPGYPVFRRPRALETLAAEYTVHLYDQRGCGRSTRPFTRAPEGRFYQRLVAIESKLGLAEQVADIERIRRTLGQEKIVLLGHSFGALVSALYAAEFPARVSALVLVSPAALHVMPSDVDLFALVRQKLPAAAQREYDEYMASYFDFTGPMSQDEPSLSRRYGRFRAFYAQAVGMGDVANEGDVGGFMTLATYASLGRRHDWRSALARITAPTVVLHGTLDLVSDAHTREFAAAIPGARVEVVEAGHFPLDEAADAVAAAVRQAARAAGAAQPAAAAQ